MIETKHDCSLLNCPYCGFSVYNINFEWHRKQCQKASEYIYDRDNLPLYTIKRERAEKAVDAAWEKFEP